MERSTTIIEIRKSAGRDNSDASAQGTLEDTHGKPSTSSLQSRKVALSHSPSANRKARTTSPQYDTDFDTLFENPSRFHPRLQRVLQVDSLDEGVYSFDQESGRTVTSEEDPVARVTVTGGEKQPGTDKPLKQARLTRGDSLMQLSLSDMLTNNYMASKGFNGFRSRTANQVAHKYCSYWRVDDMVFIFLYIVFGIIYICAGSLGLINCTSERLTNVFLIVDGVFSVFIFPVTIMEWTKRIGSCISETEKVSSPVNFIIICILRLASCITGTVIFSSRLDSVPGNNPMCFGIITVLTIGVVLEWLFILLAIICPFSLYFGAFFWARLTVNKK